MILKNVENVKVPQRISKQLNVETQSMTSPRPVLKSAMKKNQNESDFLDFKSQNAPSTIYPVVQKNQDPNTSIQEDDDS